MLRDYLIFLYMNARIGDCFASLAMTKKGIVSCEESAEADDEAISMRIKPHKSTR